MADTCTLELYYPQNSCASDWTTETVMPSPGGGGGGEALSRRTHERDLEAVLLRLAGSRASCCQVQG